MRLILKEEQSTYRLGGPSVVVLGTFDGVHRGHTALIREAQRLGRRYGLPTLVYTFREHPQHVLSQRGDLPLLTTPEEKALAIAALGPDALVMRPFTPDFAALSPAAFTAHLRRALRPRHLVVGENYSFGAGGRGKTRDLRRLAARYGIRTHVLPPVMLDGAVVSSTRVRQAVGAGEMERAARLLGCPYGLRGRVATGKRIGRGLGFPTANLPFPAGKALPPYGVYIAQARVEGGEYPAVLNIGRHPTLPEGPPTIEAFLLDAELDLYGRMMDVALLRFLRPERKFEDVEALRAQIGRDVQAAWDFFGPEGKPGNLPADRLQNPGDMLE